MKKSVIIDKGNGLQQRLSYDDGTNKIIPETTFGPRQTDNVLPVVGKKFIDETDLSVAYGEDCLFCKGKKNTSGIPFATQCAILSGIEVSYSTCAGPLYQTTFYTLKYIGIPMLNYRIVIKFYDTSGVNFESRYLLESDFPETFFLHQNSTNRADISVITTGQNFKTGECILPILAKGASPLNLYKDVDNMKLLFDHRSLRIKYVNLNKNKNLNYVDLMTTYTHFGAVNLVRLYQDKIYSLESTNIFNPNYPGGFRMWWNPDATYGNKGSHLIGAVTNNFAPDTFTILGFEQEVQGRYCNAIYPTHASFPKGTENDPPKGG